MMSNVREAPLPLARRPSLPRDLADRLASLDDQRLRGRTRTRTARSRPLLCAEWVSHHELAPGRRARARRVLGAAELADLPALLRRARRVRSARALGARARSNE